MAVEQSATPMTHWVGGVTHEEIAKLAYELWEQCGRPADEETAIILWLYAERILQRPYW
jgi:hypothetical protein